MRLWRGGLCALPRELDLLGYETTERVDDVLSVDKNRLLEFTLSSRFKFALLVRTKARQLD